MTRKSVVKETVPAKRKPATVKKPKAITARTPVAKKEPDVISDMRKQVNILRKAMSTYVFTPDWDFFGEDTPDAYAWFVFKNMKDGAFFAVRFHTEDKKKIFTLHGLTDLFSYEVDVCDVELVKEDKGSATVVFKSKYGGIFTHVIRVNGHD